MAVCQCELFEHWDRQMDEWDGHDDGAKIWDMKPVETDCGTFKLCKPCRDAKHMQRDGDKVWL